MALYPYVIDAAIVVVRLYCTCSSSLWFLGWDLHHGDDSICATNRALMNFFFLFYSHTAHTRTHKHTHTGKPDRQTQIYSLVLKDGSAPEALIQLKQTKGMYLP